MPSRSQQETMRDLGDERVRELIGGYAAPLAEGHGRSGASRSLRVAPGNGVAVSG
jgi:hypothetical protein